ncbi:hypothetical protein O5853_29780, partial [Escherichia coli]|nr:hypothetical protein [Escherichia coli]
GCPATCAVQDLNSPVDLSPNSGEIIALFASSHILESPINLAITALFYYNKLDHKLAAQLGIGIIYQDRHRFDSS